jgi:hypothetical protein
VSNKKRSLLTIDHPRAPASPTKAASAHAQCRPTLPACIVSLALWGSPSPHVALTQRQNATACRAPKNPGFNSSEALELAGTDGTAMRKGAASTRGSGSTTPAQRNLLSARPNSDLAVAELQKDGSGLQARGGCFPPLRRRSDRCHRRRGRTTELGPRSTSTAATDRHCFLLAPATVAPAHSVQQGRRRSPCFALLLLSSS